MTDLKLYTCTDHDGYYPVGVSSIVLAFDEASAREMLLAKLRSLGLGTKEDFTLTQVEMTNPRAIILQNGDY